MERRSKIAISEFSKHQLLEVQEFHELFLWYHWITLLISTHVAGAHIIT